VKEVSRACWFSGAGDAVHDAGCNNVAWHMQLTAVCVLSAGVTAAGITCRREDNYPHTRRNHDAIPYANDLCDTVMLSHPPTPQCVCRPHLL
jgi:hypothetical protein